MITPLFFTKQPGADFDVRRRDGGHAVAHGKAFAIELTSRPSDEPGDTAMRLVVRGRMPGRRGGEARPTWRLWSLEHWTLDADEAAEFNRDLADELVGMLRGGHSLYETLSHADAEFRRMRKRTGRRL